MIITKKRFEEEIAKVRAEEQAKYEKYSKEYDEKRWMNERLYEIDKRMDRAFEDIARRLDEIEKRSPAPVVDAVRPRY